MLKNSAGKGRKDRIDEVLSRTPLPGPAMSRLSSCAIAAACVFVLTVSVRADGGGSVVPLYKVAGAPIPQRVADLLSRMSVAEKIPQLFASQLPPSKSIPTFNGTGLGLVSLNSLPPLKSTPPIRICEIATETRRTNASGGSQVAVLCLWLCCG